RAIPREVTMVEGARVDVDRSSGWADGGRHWPAEGRVACGGCLNKHGVGAVRSGKREDLSDRTVQNRGIRHAAGCANWSGGGDNRSAVGWPHGVQITVRTTDENLVVVGVQEGPCQLVR